MSVSFCPSKTNPKDMMVGWDVAACRPLPISSPFSSKFERSFPSPLCCISTGEPTRRSFHQPHFVRRWIEPETATVSPFLSKSRVSVVSYNILGDDNASNHRDLYAHIPSHFMNWDRRKRLIWQELKGWDADIVCLQEVDRYDDLLSDMKKEGYIGNFKRRTGEAMDGCAMLWKKNLVRLLEGESIQFKGFGLRDNVAQLLVFEMSKDEPRRFLVGNIHVLFNPNRGDIKLGQIRLLLHKAHMLSKKWGGIPAVLAGDFNSTPQSAIYKFLSSSELSITMYDRRHLSGQNRCLPAQFLGMPTPIRKPFISSDRFVRYSWTDEELITATGSSKCTDLVHPLKLYSSYATLKGNARTRDIRGEPLATTYNSKFLGAVDYLWYTEGLAPTRVLDTLPIGILRTTGGLPSKKLGSDHLALVSEFAFVQSGREEELQYTATETASTTGQGFGIANTASEA